MGCASSAGAGHDVGQSLTALARAGVLDELRANLDGCVVWQVGAGEDELGARLADLVGGLRLLAIGACGAEAVDSGPPTERHDPPALTIVGACADAGSASLEPWLEHAFELRCPYVYARRLADARPRAEAVDRWYWRYDVAVATGGRLRLREVRRQAPRACHNRYRHTVGWRRMLPSLPPA